MQDLIPTILSTIGAASGKWLVLAASGGAPVSSIAADSLADIIGWTISDHLQKREIERSYEEIIDLIAKRMKPLLDFEEKKGTNVGRILELSALAINRNPPNTNSILRDEIDPRKVRDSFIETINAEVSHVSEREESILKTILGEIAQFICELSISLPKYRVVIEQRNSRVIKEFRAIAEQILDKIPDRQDAVYARDAQDNEFELSYKRIIASRLDEVELFGVELPRHLRRYKLTVAYINLNLRDRLTEGYSLIKDINALLNQRRRLFIEGEAGSGKTTLLQWLAVQAARGELAVSGGNAPIVPIFVRLRSFAGERLPNPTEMVSLQAPTIADEMPDGWATRTLVDRRGLVLVDGLDELAGKGQEEVVSWINDLVERFPETRIVLTSRPAGTLVDDIRRLGFSEADIEPMRTSQVRQLIEQWHAAVSEQPVFRESVEEIERLKNQLIVSIKHNRDLRSLARTPLICALICALNIKMQGELPKRRRGLYDSALEMFLEKRDIERHMTFGRNLGLEKDALLGILGQIAYWMVFNSMASVKRTRLTGRLGKFILPRMPSVKASAEDVIEYMLNRTGLLRQVGVDEIDFPHLTFQEYMAAGQAIFSDDVELLLGKAGDDRWTNVIIFASGFAQAEQLDRLIGGLLDESNLSELLSYKRKLIAIGCREMLTVLDPHLQRKMESVLSSLFPPKNYEEARLLSYAGPLIFPHVRDVKVFPESSHRYIVRMLSWIEDDESIELIREYVKFNGEGVTEEAISAWWNFDREKYGKQVISQTTFKGPLPISGDSAVLDIKHFHQLEEIYIKGVSVSNVQGLGLGSTIKKMTISDCATLLSVRGIGVCKELQEVSFINNAELSEFSALRNCKDLWYLKSVGCPGQNSLTGIKELSELEVLELEGWTSLESIAELRSLKNLRSLSLAGCVGITDISALVFLDFLEQVDLDGCYGIEDFCDLERLRSLKQVTLPDKSATDTLSPIFKKTVFIF